MYLYTIYITACLIWSDNPEIPLPTQNIFILCSSVFHILITFHTN